jgi:hypothetical protein
MSLFVTVPRMIRLAAPLRLARARMPRFANDERGSLPGDLGKAAVAIAFLSVAAAHVMSMQVSRAERDVLGEMAQIASSGRAVDAGATGSLLRRANQTPLDPCAEPPRAR